LRLTDAFTGRKALITYLCCGDPSVDETVELALVCASAGADVIELGVPFSDPTADGPAIARASQRALERGGGLRATLDAARRIREKTDVPIVLFGYYNPIFTVGEALVCQMAKESGVDALLVVDLPVEEGSSLREHARANGLAVVPLLTPTSSAARREATRRAMQECPAGFVYYVSVTGVTGHAAAPLEAASLAAAELRRDLGCPTVVGFGVDSAERARQAARHADGVVVGTALVRRIEDGKTPEARAAAVRELVDELARAVQTAR
jgi:tryptophan synthase alpha chain